MKQQNKLEFLTWVAGVFIIISFTDLVYNVYQTKNTSNLSYSWMGLIIAAQLLYLIFGLINHIEGIYIPAVIIILMISYIFYVKIIINKNS